MTNENLKKLTSIMKKGGLCSLKEILDNNASDLINLKDDEREILLYIAKEILDNNASNLINLKDDERETLLRIAKEILDNKASNLTNLKDDERETLLHIAKEILDKNTSNLINLKDDERKTPLHIAIEQPNINDKIITELLAIENLDLLYCYHPVNQRKYDGYLHIAAQERNVTAFLKIYKKSVGSNINLLKYNGERETPLHILAKNGILRDVVKEIVSSLKSSKDEEISSLKEQIKSCKEKLNCNNSQEEISKFKKEITDIEKKYEYHLRSLRDAIRSPDQHKKTPLHWTINTYERREIKETLGVNSLISNKNIRTSLLILGAAVTIATMCVALYLLYATAPPLALVSAISFTSTGIGFFMTRISSEFIDLSTENLSSDLLQSNA